MAEKKTNGASQARWDKLQSGARQPTIGKLVDVESRSKDILGRVYKYFLGRFAAAEGKGGSVSFEEKKTEVTTRLYEQFAESERLEAVI